MGSGKCTRLHGIGIPVSGVYLDKTQKIQLNKQKTHILASNEYKKTCENNSIDKPINNLEREVLKTSGPIPRAPMNAFALRNYLMLTWPMYRGQILKTF